MTTFTAVRLDDADVSDPNSGFYPTQATTEQINSIPTESKGPGEVIYNITTGKLMLYNGTSWTTLNSSLGFTRPLIAAHGSNNVESNSGAEGEQILYMPLDSFSVLKAEDFTIPDDTKNEILYNGTSSIVIYYTIALGIFINSIAATPNNNMILNLYLNQQDIIDRIVLYEVKDMSFYRLSFSRSITLNPGNIISCGIETPDVGYTLYGINMTIMSI